MEEQPSANRRNRGKSSEDEALFNPPKERLRLMQALEDMYYLLTKHYPLKASLALVGNRYRLKTRQIFALQGMCAAQQEVESRHRKELAHEQLKGQTLYVDGFNILILLETLLSGGYIFRGIDGCYRDISSVHGTYKKVNQTEDVFVLVGQTLQQLQVDKTVWIFDKPVSNSGRLKSLCYELAEKHGFEWEIFLDNAPDKYLVESKSIVCSSDAWILNNCTSWFNLGGYIINKLYNSERPENVIELLPDLG